MCGRVCVDADEVLPLGMGAWMTSANTPLPTCGTLPYLGMSNKERTEIPSEKFDHSRTSGLSMHMSLKVI